MFWSGETLKDRLPALSPDFKPDAVDCNAWTLTIGRRIYKTPTAAEAAAGTHTIQTLAEGADFPIPPGQFAYLETKENLHVPNDAMGFISVKADIKLQGLINVSGFHIDPGFSGHLVFTVYNAGPAPIHLRQGQQCFLVWFASLDRESGADNVRRKVGKRITGNLISPVAGKLQSIDDLSVRLSRVEQDLRVHQGIRGNFTAMTVTLVGAFAGAIIGAIASVTLTTLASQPAAAPSKSREATPPELAAPHPAPSKARSALPPMKN